LFFLSFFLPPFAPCSLAKSAALFLFLLLLAALLSSASLFSRGSETFSSFFGRLQMREEGCEGAKQGGDLLVLLLRSRATSWQRHL